MHTADHIRFTISQLRQDKLVYATESIAVFVFSLFMSIFLPNILLQFVFTDPMMTELPAFIQYIPVAGFALGVAYFLFAMGGNIMRFTQIKKLEAELATMSHSHDCCCDGECAVSEPMTSASSQPAKRGRKPKSVQ